MNRFIFELNLRLRIHYLNAEANHSDSDSIPIMQNEVFNADICVIYSE